MSVGRDDISAHAGASAVAVFGTVPAGQGAIAAVLCDAARFADSSDLVAATRHRLAVVVEEIVANIVAHGEVDPDSEIAYRFEPDGGAIRMRFVDHGVAFDPRVDLPPGAAPGDTACRAAADPGGLLGWRLILSWCEIAEYRREHGANRIVLTMPAG